MDSGLPLCESTRWGLCVARYQNTNEQPCKGDPELCKPYKHSMRTPLHRTLQAG